MAKQIILTEAELEAEKERTRLFNSDDWLVTILAQPELASICPWQLFNSELTWGFGPEHSHPWRDILLTHPEMIKYAPVPFPAEYLDVCDWAEILFLHPQLKSKVPWKKLEWRRDIQCRIAWTKLLVRYPKFAKYCDWSIFYHRDGGKSFNEWIRLLQLRPEFLEYYLKSLQRQDETSILTLIEPWEWALIVAFRPELLVYAPKRKFTNMDWLEIIDRQPQLRPKRMTPKSL
jgi:hypothetical protein